MGGRRRLALVLIGTLCCVVSHPLRDTGVVTGRGFAAPPPGPGRGFAAPPPLGGQVAQGPEVGGQTIFIGQGDNYGVSEVFGSVGFGGQTSSPFAGRSSDVSHRGQSDVYTAQNSVYGRQSDVYGGQGDVYGGQTDVYRGQSDVYGGQSNVYGGQSDGYERQSDFKPYYSKDKSNSYGGQSDVYGGHSDVYRGQSDVYRGQSDVSWGDIQEPWQATSDRGQSLVNTVNTGQSDFRPYYSKDTSDGHGGQTEEYRVQSGVYGGQSEGYGGQSSSGPGSYRGQRNSYQTAFSVASPAYGNYQKEQKQRYKEEEEIISKLQLLYQRVKRKKAHASAPAPAAARQRPPASVTYGRQGGRGGVRFPTELEEIIPTGRPGLNLGESFQTRGSRDAMLSTEEWLQYRGARGDAVHYPAASSKKRDHDIITVDNIHAWVEPPRGPDVFTINVESALNFAGRR